MVFGCRQRALVTPSTRIGVTQTLAWVSIAVRIRVLSVGRSITRSVSSAGPDSGGVPPV